MMDVSWVEDHEKYHDMYRNIFQWILKLHNQTEKKENKSENV